MLKKLAATIVTIMMLLSLAIPAFAGSATADNDTGNIIGRDKTTQPDSKTPKPAPRQG